MALTKEIEKRIKLEIINDPEKVGYATMTSEQQMAAINNPVPRTKIVEYTDLAPISRILAGLSESPNIVDLPDIQAALISAEGV